MKVCIPKTSSLTQVTEIYGENQVTEIFMNAVGDDADISFSNHAALPPECTVYSERARKVMLDT
ncbi:hypothetical protein E2C01_020741 [Portunus trituberculatus]|uniref:Uncharacterized protein n=1 Tax=Portunus trituberculatus TaxID=210409 RepID=A0A5B7E2K5_PORTR|nr:hypothetical protein [Portunus trituberculatus]